MTKIQNITELQKLKSELLQKKEAMLDPQNEQAMAEVKVGMGTSGLASGAREVFDFLTDAISKRNIMAKIKQVGDMGYCYAEPTIEVQLPGKEPIVFGDVDVKKADSIIERYIKKGELVDGIIPVNYFTVDQ